MSELPDGWVEAAVDDTGSYINGMAFKPTDWEQDGRPIIRIQNLTDPNKPLNRTTRQVEGRYIVCPGDLLVSWSATLDAFIWDREEAVLNQHIFKVEPNTNVIDPRFLFFGLREVIAEMREGEHLHGSTMKHINRGPFLAHRFPIPPLPEQRRIVAKLDGLSARTKAARAHLARVQSLATRAKQATLAAAFDPAENPAWGRSAVEQVLAEGLIGLVRSKTQQSDKGTPYIRMNHYDLNGRWNDKDLTFVDVSAREFQRFELRPQDLLFNTRNSAELVGKVALWPEGRPGHVFNNNLLRMRFRKDVDPEFAYLYMISPVFREFLESVKNATTSVAAIYQKSLMRGPFPVPEIEEQKAIVRHIETTFARIDRMVEDATRAAHLLDRLDQRLLAKAFRGELVPQDPNDEPAAELLARIQATRAAAPKPKLGRRTRA